MNNIFLHKILHIQHSNQYPDERKRKIQQIDRTDIQSMCQETTGKMYGIFQDNGCKSSNNTNQKTQ